MADTLKSTSQPKVHGQVVVNPDGSSISSGSATEAKQDSILSQLVSLTTTVNTTVTLTTADTAYKLPTTEQSGRRVIVVYNASDTDVYLGGSSVTTSNGFLLASGKSASFDISTGLYAVCGTDSKNVNVMELK